ncbi:hypothetical protein ACOME3_007143 [Neoechinorhynchus agilis]
MKITKKKTAHQFVLRIPKRLLNSFVDKNGRIPLDLASVLLERRILVDNEWFQCRLRDKVMVAVFRDEDSKSDGQRVAAIKNLPLCQLTAPLLCSGIRKKRFAHDNLLPDPELEQEPSNRLVKPIGATKQSKKKE